MRNINGPLKDDKGMCSQVRIGNDIFVVFEQCLYAHLVKWPFCRLLKTCLDIVRLKFFP